MISEVSWGEWLVKRVAEGRSLFSLEEAVRETGARLEAVRSAMHRAVRENRVARVGEGFYVVVPMEFRSQGAPPYEWVVEARFARLGRRYYLGLLTAAQYHGASHQQPMEIQVMTDRQMRRSVFGKVRIHPIFRKEWPKESLLEKRVTRTGEFLISGPELTLVDAVRYPAHAGGWDNIATLITEMAGKLHKRPLAQACRQTSETPVLQRLGWLLTRLGSEDLGEVVHAELESRRMQTVPLETGGAADGPVDPRFRVRINHEPVPEA